MMGSKEHLAMPTHQQFVQKYFQLKFSSKSFALMQYIPAFHKIVIYVELYKIVFSMTLFCSSSVRQLPVAL